MAHLAPTAPGLAAAAARLSPPGPLGLAPARVARRALPEPTPVPESRAGSLAAERFQRALAIGPLEAAQPLPQHFRPLARAIVGNRAVSVRSGPMTRSALAAAGKPAATVGNVIHLRRHLDRSPESVELLAHELVHAARPSSAARFFGDDRRGHEEHVAEHTGRLARALVASEVALPPASRRHDRLSWGTQGLPVGNLGGAAQALSVDRAARLPAPPPPPPPAVQRRSSTGGTPSLVQRTADLFRQQAAGGSGGTAPAVAGAGSAAALATNLGSVMSPMSNTNLPIPHPGNAPIVRHSTWPGVQRFNSGGGTGLDVGTVADTTSDRPTTIGGVDVELFEALVEALEQRVIDELERRGLRHHPGVF